MKPASEVIRDAALFRRTPPGLAAASIAEWVGPGDAAWGAVRARLRAADEWFDHSTLSHVDRRTFLYLVSLELAEIETKDTWGDRRPKRSRA